MRAKLSKSANLLKLPQLVSIIGAMLLLCAYSPLDKKEDGKILTVAIDAGHGGHDAGCSYGGAKEKDVTLAIALKLGKAIEKIMPDVTVIYTRAKDEFIELHERAGIANRKNAHLFISIHCNANKKTEVFGTETFSMGLHKSDGNLEVAKRENEVILLEKDYQEKYEGFDPNSPEAHIYFSFLQSAYLEQSLKLAAKVEQHFMDVKRSSRGVKQAGLMVLWKSKMPSVLIETGFLSNAKERAYLTGEQGQDELANAIANAVKEYKTSVEKK
ncbi:MAG: N-acetylmuramoyl-L-alanine amidase [Bacteroidia bacterium]|jgi:N-acetylmuramoyl-L-alanine amidase|nr:N-acetylmuramoyl-L-alanine amidase [Bacteroidia bacterium]